MKDEFYFPSADDITQIHVSMWKPEGEPAAILQIIHGMREYIDRYEGFAEYLSEKGFLVAGNDHLGHGKSVADENAYGFFSKKLGPDDVLADIHTLRVKLEEKHPGIPYFMLGHSMGSALLRCYLTRHSEGLAGAIIMGSFTAPPAAVAVAQRLCRIDAGLHKWHHFSKLVDGLAAGGYNKKFKDPDTSVDWLSKNPENNRKYANDPLCNHPFTVNAYFGMFEALKQAEKVKNMENIRKDLPLLLVSGDEDPVGHMGKDIPRIAKWYRDVKITDVRVKLYKGDRHEILNELDRKKVFQDLCDWLTERIEAGINKE